jgi:DNA-binding MarR family transcriptional regulator
MKSEPRKGVQPPTYHSKYPSFDAEALELNRLLRATYHSLIDSFQRCLAASGFGGNYSRYLILRSLAFVEGGNLPQSEISRQLGVTSGNVSRLLDGLEQEGLIKRTVNGLDRRATNIQLTPEGQAICDRVMPPVVELSTLLCEGFSTEDRAGFRDYLERFKENADSIYPMKSESWYADAGPLP